MNCPACGKDTVDGAAFCQHCGARLGGCCPICGNPIVENALFCQRCGARLDAVKPAPAPVFVPAPAQGQADEPCKAAEEEPGQSAWPGAAEAVPSAGQPAAGAPEEPVAQAPQADGPGAADAQGLPPVPEGPNGYYRWEFDKLSRGARASFNFAACFLGFWHTLYRGCWRRFLLLYSWLGVLTTVTGLAAVRELEDNVWLNAAYGTSLWQWSRNVTALAGLVLSERREKPADGEDA